MWIHFCNKTFFCELCTIWDLNFENLPNRIPRQVSRARLEWGYRTSAAAAFAERCGHLNSVRRSKTARVIWRAVAIREFISILLNARIMAGSHLSSVRHFKTARVIWRAVEFAETTSILLNARMMAGSHLRSVRHFKTARMIWRAVEFAETTSILLRTKIWYKTVIRSSNIKLDKVDCFLALNSAAC